MANFKNKSGSKKNSSSKKKHQNNIKRKQQSNSSYNKQDNIFKNSSSNNNNISFGINISMKGNTEFPELSSNNSINSLNKTETNFANIIKNVAAVETENISDRYLPDKNNDLNLKPGWMLIKKKIIKLLKL